MRIDKIVGIIFLVGATYFLILSPFGLVKIVQLRLQIQKIEHEMSILRAKEVTLEHEIRLLQSDTSYVHKVAREKFGIE
jgi:cell division protein FtsB